MSFTRSLALLLLTGTAIASPVDILQKRKTFSIEQVPKGPKPAVPLLMKKTYGKYKATVPADVEAAAAAAATGTVTATPEDDDVEYLCPVSVGGTTLNLDFDTGSADL